MPMLELSELIARANALSAAGYHEKQKSLWEKEDLSDYYSRCIKDINDFIFKHHIAGLGGNVLDVGCGWGFQSNYLRALGADVWEFDQEDQLKYPHVKGRTFITDIKICHLSCMVLLMYPCYSCVFLTRKMNFRLWK